MRTIGKPVQAIKHLVYSKRDMYGNCYGYIRVTNTKTGESIEALVDSIGNEDYILNKMGLAYTSSEAMLPIREFNRQAKGLPYNYVEELHKLFGKSYKAYVAKVKREDEARQRAQDEYIKRVRAREAEKEGATN